VSGAGPYGPCKLRCVSVLTAPRTRAALGSLVFLVVAPGVTAVLVPWWLTGWEPARDVPWPVVAVGAVLVAAGAAVLLQAFARFVVEGIGTPAPVAPPEHLVVGGLYRYVRNPMYLAVAATIVGQALILGRPALLLYVAVFGIAVASFVHFYEEPTLAQKFGAEYDAYRRAAPAWWPRRVSAAARGRRRPDGGPRGDRG